jgi:hypothetical protein
VAPTSDIVTESIAVLVKTDGISAKSKESKARRRDVESKVISKLIRLYTNTARKTKERVTAVRGSASTKLITSPFRSFKSHKTFFKLFLNKCYLHLSKH